MKQPFWVHCETCSHEWAAAFLPMQVNVFVKLAKTLCPMCGAKNVLVGQLPKNAIEGDVHAWLTNGDTGVSSKTIWSILTGRATADDPWWQHDVPHDPDDFGRCYRLLKIMPSWRSRLPEVVAVFPDWAPLVNAWDELSALFEEESPKRHCPKLYKRMQELRGL